MICRDRKTTVSFFCGHNDSFLSRDTKKATLLQAPFFKARQGIFSLVRSRSSEPYADAVSRSRGRKARSIQSQKTPGPSLLRDIPSLFHCFYGMNEVKTRLRNKKSAHHLQASA